jgi:large subunit ribosomal protein L31e
VKSGPTIMGTQPVKIDHELNRCIWQRSQANPPVRVRVVFERKADDKGNSYTVAALQDVASFGGLKTEKVVE